MMKVKSKPSHFAAVLLRRYNAPKLMIYLACLVLKHSQMWKTGYLDMKPLLW